MLLQTQRGAGWTHLHAGQSSCMQSPGLHCMPACHPVFNWALMYSYPPDGFLHMHWNPRATTCLHLQGARSQTRWLYLPACPSHRPPHALISTSSSTRHSSQPQTLPIMAQLEDPSRALIVAVDVDHGKHVWEYALQVGRRRLEGVWWRLLRNGQSTRAVHGKGCVFSALGYGCNRQEKKNL